MSITKLDGSDLFFAINTWRLSNNLKYLTNSAFLTELANEHVKKILKNEIPFGFQHSEIRKRKVSSLVQGYDEILIDCDRYKNIFNELLLNKKTQKVLSSPLFNVVGFSMFECGKKTFLFLLLGETW